MWTCLVCEAEIDEDSWETCWRCSSDKGAKPDELALERQAHAKKIKRFMSCLRCNKQLVYDGTRRFKEDDSLEIHLMGFQLGSRSERFDIYHCPECGHLEFFLDGVGDAKRGEPD